MIGIGNNNEPTRSDVTSPGAGGGSTVEAPTRTSGVPSKEAWHYKTFWVSLGAAIAMIASQFQSSPQVQHWCLVIGVVVGCVGNIVPLFFGSEPQDPPKSS